MLSLHQAIPKVPYHSLRITTYFAEILFFRGASEERIFPEEIWKPCLAQSVIIFSPLKPAGFFPDMDP